MRAYVDYPNPDFLHLSTINQRSIVSHGRAVVFIQKDDIYPKLAIYVCPTLRKLKEKLLQLPHGSVYGFAWYFDERDEKETLEATAFLAGHGLSVTNAHRWNFLPSDPPR